MKHIKGFKIFESDVTKLDIINKKGSEYRSGIVDLINSDIEGLKKLIESGELDPNIENHFILRAAVKYKKNDLLRIVAPLTVDLPRRSNIIGMCYELDNIEAADIIINNLKFTKSDLIYILERAINWLKYSSSFDKTKLEEYTSDINNKIEKIK